jgi:predicted RNA-binding protein with PUA-like domain
MAANKSRGRKRKLDVTNSVDEKIVKTDTVATSPYTHWLMKSEPESRIEKGVDMKFSFEDLKAMPDSTSCWDGVRNYQARNFMRDMKVGQLAFFYHSNTRPPGIVGIVEIVREAYTDYTQFDSKDPHYDPAATKVRYFYIYKLNQFFQLSSLGNLVFPTTQAVFEVVP